jgi:hypothetical protein
MFIMKVVCRDGVSTGKESARRVRKERLLPGVGPNPSKPETLVDVFTRRNEGKL